MPDRLRCSDGLLLEDLRRPYGLTVFCADCGRPWCAQCESNHFGANDPSRHDDPTRGNGL